MNLFNRVRSRVMRTAKIQYRKLFARKSGIIFLRPNYIFIDKFTGSSVIIDAGCGYDADLSVQLIRRYGLTSFGLDPTHKHALSLQQLERGSNGKFKHLKVAVASFDGEAMFHESLDNVSGSLSGEHQNILTDRIASYTVETVSLRNLPLRVGHDTIAYLKLDLEGAEYQLLANLTEAELMPFDQIFVEFHHHCVRPYSKKDTESAVLSIKERGFNSFSLDDHNFLFFRMN
jgi:FkbM family methyltransferase